jgi:hypothetical protein
MDGWMDGWIVGCTEETASCSLRAPSLKSSIVFLPVNKTGVKDEAKKNFCFQIEKD